MIAQLESMVMRRSPRWRRSLIRTWYQVMTILDRHAVMRCMNYGYTDDSLEAQPLSLPSADAGQRYGIQLYHHLAAAVDLQGRDVLEVGSGRGGGAAYIARAFEPRSVVGMDFSDRAVRFCRSFYNVRGLTFVPGDAEALPFASSSFDVVINVESSHCYPNVEQFFREVARVLRPGGSFLFTDHRSQEDVPLLREQLMAAGMRFVRDQSITANVLRALDLDQERKLQLINQHAPPLVRARFTRFAGMQGSPIYEAFRHGTLDYRSCVVQKHG